MQSREDLSSSVLIGTLDKVSLGQPTSLDMSVVGKDKDLEPFWMS